MTQNPQKSHPLYLRPFFIILLLGMSVIALAACSQEGSDDHGPAAAVEAYFQALVVKDSSRLSNLSCSTWEAEAQKELNSFGAVTAELRELDCTAVEADEENAEVSCSGVIAANYGNEVLEIDLADRPIQAVYEDGEWRMCGYR